MSETKYCFYDRERVCDLSCKAAFQVDDPVDNVDCYFIWLAHHFGEGLFSLRNLAESLGAGGLPNFPPGSPPGPGSPGSGPKSGGWPSN
jgi:hypothetical protein